MSFYQQSSILLPICLLLNHKVLKTSNRGIGSIILIWIAFAILGKAIKTIDLAVAYTLWGAIGVVGTALFGRILFGHKFKPIGWFGIFMITLAVILLSMS